VAGHVDAAVLSLAQHYVCNSDKTDGFSFIVIFQ
jgi:hypothetical protein